MKLNEINGVKHIDHISPPLHLSIFFLPLSLFPRPLCVCSHVTLLVILYSFLLLVSPHYLELSPVPAVVRLYLSVVALVLKKKERKGGEKSGGCCFYANAELMLTPFCDF